MIGFQDQGDSFTEEDLRGLLQNQQYQPYGYGGPHSTLQSGGLQVPPDLIAALGERDRLQGRRLALLELQNSRRLEEQSQSSRRARLAGLLENNLPNMSSSDHGMILQDLQMEVPGQDWDTMGPPQRGPELQLGYDF